MDRIHELIDVLSNREVQARTLHAKLFQICKICQKPANTFHSAFFKAEYDISTICETCLKYYLELSNPCK